mgnify:CR=1 FL=1
MPTKHELTIQIESKGYTLNEFLEQIGFSLRWYRVHSHNDALRYKFLVRKINELKEK